SVFNSAMILHGLVHYYMHFADVTVLAAAARCADWLCSVQESDGSWSRANFRGLKRTYNAEVAASLAEFYVATNNERYRHSAERGADWVVTQQVATGWYQNCDNTETYNDRPLTHLIGYTTRGLIICGVLLTNDTYVESARRCLAAIMKHYPLHSGKLIDGRPNRNWEPTMGASCLTGVAQIAVSLFLLNECKPAASNIDYARWLNSMVAQTQLLNCKRPGARGGI